MRRSGTLWRYAGRRRKGQRGLKAGDAEGRAIKFLVFFMRRVRRVVGGDAIHSAVSQTGEQCFAVFTRAQRRIHFVVGVVLADASSAG